MPTYNLRGEVSDTMASARIDEMFSAESDDKAVEIARREIKRLYIMNPKLYEVRVISLESTKREESRCKNRH